MKSGFLQEEDVRIVSKQIKDRITQVRMDLVEFHKSTFAGRKIPVAKFHCEQMVF